MVIDNHYHFDERIIKIEDTIKKSLEAGIDKVCLMSALCDPLKTPPEITGIIGRFLITTKITKNLAKWTLTRFTTDGHLNLLGNKIKIYQTLDNKTIFDLIKKYPDRLFGWVFVNPNSPIEPLKELQKWSQKKGFIGVKSHSYWHRFSPVKLAPLGEELVKLNRPLLNHFGFDKSGDFESLLKEVPRLKIIFAHAAFPGHRETWKKIKGNKNIYVDLSQSTYVGDKMIKEVVEYLGVEQCIFGTDGPYGPTDHDKLFDHGYLKRKIEKIFPDKMIQKRLLGENFIELISD